MATDPVAPYWVRVSSPGEFATYEHRPPHGTLVMVRDRSTITGDPAMAMVFVPAAPPPVVERP